MCPNAVGGNANSLHPTPACAGNSLCALVAAFRAVLGSPSTMTALTEQFCVCVCVALAVESR
eukprot:3521389-Rhodomonas_salina.3